MLLSRRLAIRTPHFVVPACALSLAACDAGTSDAPAESAVSPSPTNVAPTATQPAAGTAPPASAGAPGSAASPAESTTPGTSPPPQPEVSEPPAPDDPAPDDTTPGVPEPAPAAGGAPGDIGDPQQAAGGNENMGAGGAGGTPGDIAGGAPGTEPDTGAVQPPNDDPSTWFIEPTCRDYVLCETFEETAIGQLPAGFSLVGYGERTVGVSDERPARGAQSLRVEVPSQAAVVGMIETAAPSELSVSHWGRSFVWLQTPVPSEFVHYDLFAGVGPWTTYDNEVRWAVTGTGVGNDAGNQSFIYNVQPSGNGAPGEFGTEGDRSAHPVEGDWMCLEWFFDADAQEARFFFMGTEVDYLHIDDERAEIPEFSALRVGFQKFQQTAPFVVFVDEVAFHTERIGCNN